jgi:hypothetical protein
VILTFSEYPNGSGIFDVDWGPKTKILNISHFLSAFIFGFLYFSGKKLGKVSSERNFSPFINRPL